MVTCGCCPGHAEWQAATIRWTDLRCRLEEVVIRMAPAAVASHGEVAPRAVELIDWHAWLHKVVCRDADGVDVHFVKSRWEGVRVLRPVSATHRRTDESGRKELNLG